MSPTDELNCLRSSYSEIHLPFAPLLPFMMPMRSWSFSLGSHGYSHDFKMRVRKEAARP